MRAAWRGGFRTWVAVTDFAVLSLLITAVVPTLPQILDPRGLREGLWAAFLAYATGISIVLSVFVAFAALRLRSSRELPGRRPSPSASQERLPEDEERRSTFPPALLRGTAPRGFPAAWAFRRRAAMLPVVPYLLLGFMAFCLWVAVVVPDMAPPAMLGVLIYPTYVGFGTSSRLHLLGAGLREQHHQNLRALAMNVALPAAVIGVLLIAVVGPSQDGWTALALLGAALVLRAGVTGYWRLARRAWPRARSTPILVALVALPFVPPILGFDGWFEITVGSLAVFYAAVGGSGLVIHIASLDERVLRDEMLRDAERGVAA